MQKAEFQKELRRGFDGDLYFDPVTCSVYSVDASIFEIPPLGVAIPRNLKDLVHLTKVCSAYGISLTPRGAATGITGGCLGRGIIVDTSVYLNQILEINLENRTAICQPGVVQDALNQRLGESGFRLGPDTSTGNRATLGGMVANNAAGSRSLRFGTMLDHVEEVQMLLANGELISFKQVTEEEWQKKCQLQTTEGRLYRDTWSIRQAYADEIRLRYPQIPRLVSGYNLDALTGPGPYNLAKLIVGSEGTLGIITSIKVKIVPKPSLLGIVLIGFDRLLDAFKETERILSYYPTAFELIDHNIIEAGKESPSLKGQIDWLKGKPEALLMLEFEGNTPEELRQKVAQLPKMGSFSIPIFDSVQMKQVWSLRKAGLGLLLSKRSYSRAVAFIEDLTLPPLQLAGFMAEFLEYLRKKGKSAGIYGHIGAGCMHIRPYMDLRDPREVSLMRNMMTDIAHLVLKHGGSLSGEHGDGLIRSWLNPLLYGNKLMGAFGRLKQSFDPQGIMNPGKVYPLTDTFEELRADQKPSTDELLPFQNFDREGGFYLAADLCNGNGLCRKSEGVMCPSFQATGEEIHSTRARAQALRAVMHHRLPLEAMTSQEMANVMDLCVSCKGCKSECPSQVDMAKMKSEFLFHYQEKHGYSLRSKLFGNIDRLNGIASYLPQLYNGITALTQPLQGLVGLAPQRRIPPLALTRFSDWFAKYQQPKNLPQTAVLFNDTFNEFHQPEVGKAAVQILNRLGYRVVVPGYSCCGRPALTKGLLREARQRSFTLINQLYDYVQMDFPIIGLEPSCLLTIRDDYHGLVDSPKIGAIAERALLFDQFLAQHKNLDLPFTKKPLKALVHGHCHQKSSVGMAATEQVLKAIPGLQHSVIASGCCGMAGSFGYEKEHYSISMKMGELALFPAIRNSEESIIIANGFSCRHQIADGTQRSALHLSEAIAMICSQQDQT